MRQQHRDVIQECSFAYLAYLTPAGAEHGQELPPERMETLIRDAGRAPWQRTTLYAPAHTRQTARSFGAAPLAQLAMR